MKNVKNHEKWHPKQVYTYTPHIGLNTAIYIPIYDILDQNWCQNSSKIIKNDKNHVKIDQNMIQKMVPPNRSI